MKKSNDFVLLTALCSLVYFISYLTRVNFAAALAEIVNDLKIAKTAAGIAVTGSFITYGAGQIASGIIGDRVPPRIMVSVGLLGSAACNLAVAGLDSIGMISAVWCVNGLFQAMMWPPLARILGENLSFTEYTKSCAFVTAASSAATVTVYLSVPAFIRISGWRASFVTSAACAVLTVFVWFFGIARFDKKPTAKKQADQKNSGVLRQFGATGLYFVMAVIVLQGMLRDGITTWMPTYINENFSIGTGSSILTTVVLPLFSIICVAVASRLMKRLKSEFNVTLLLWSVVLIAAVLLALLREFNIAVTVALMAVITGSMYGINLMLLGNLPARFRDKGCISAVSGTLNAFTYVGSAASAYGFAAVSEKFGWGTLIVSWCGMALAALILTLLARRKWQRNLQKSDN